MPVHNCQFSSSLPLLIQGQFTTVDLVSVCHCQFSAGFPLSIQSQFTVNSVPVFHCQFSASSLSIQYLFAAVDSVQDVQELTSVYFFRTEGEHLKDGHGPQAEDHGVAA